MNDGIINGKAYWSHLVETEKFNGQDTNKFSITLIPSVEDLNNIIAEAETVFEEFKEQNLKGKKMMGEPNYGSLKEDDDGNSTLKFNTTAHIRTKSGKEFDKTVPVFDGMNRQVSKKIKSTIGNGSVVAVAYSFWPYYNTSRNFGVSFRLEAVQLLKYVPYGNGADADSFGFKTNSNAFDASSVVDDEDTADEAVHEDVPFTDEAMDSDDF